MKAKIVVTLKKSVLDPQGVAVRNALGTLGFAGVEDVRLGKFVEVRLGHSDEARAREELDKMCSQLLANPVIEEFSYELER